MESINTFESQPAPGGATTVGKGRRLQGRLGVMSLVFTVMAFNAPLAVAAGFAPLVIAFGNQEGAPATFIVIGILLGVFVVGLTAMARHIKSPGAFYSFVTAGLGRIPGLGAAFTAVGAYAAFSACIYPFIGLVTQDLVEGLFNGPHVAWWIWALIGWVLATGCSVLNIELSARMLSVALVAEVALVLVWSLFVFIDGGPSGVSVSSFTPSGFSQGSISIALLFGAMCVTGYEACAVFRDETVDPVRTVPRATYISVFVLCGLYALTAWAYLTAFGSDAVSAATADPAGSFVQSVNTYVATSVGDLVSILLVTSSFACALSVQNIGARYLFTLGRDTVLPRALGSVHPRQKSPHIAAITFSLFSLTAGIAVPAIIDTPAVRAYAVLSSIAAVFLLVLYTATSASVVAYFRRSEHKVSRWAAVIAPTLSFFALAGVLYLAVTHMAYIMGGSQASANIAIAIIVLFAAAGCALAAVLKQRSPATYARIGQQDV